MTPVSSGVLLSRKIFVAVEPIISYDWEDKKEASMSSTSTMRKTKLTITIANDVSNEIDKIAKRKGIPRSQVIEEILRYWLLKSKREAVEREIKDYYLSLTEEEKKESREWIKITTESAKRIWND